MLGTLPSFLHLRHHRMCMCSCRQNNPSLAPMAAEEMADAASEEAAAGAVSAVVAVAWADLAVLAAVVDQVVAWPCKPDCRVLWTAPQIHQAEPRDRCRWF